MNAKVTKKRKTLWGEFKQACITFVGAYQYALSFALGISAMLALICFVGACNFGYGTVSRVEASIMWEFDKILIITLIWARFSFKDAQKILLYNIVSIWTILSLGCQIGALHISENFFGDTIFITVSTGLTTTILALCLIIFCAQLYRQIKTKIKASTKAK